MGGDAGILNAEEHSIVSIHAPAWGATKPKGATFQKDYVSIHAPAWGATVRVKVADSTLKFQSTPPHGGRH